MRLFSLYNAGLRHYINKYFKCTSYDITEEEFGMIPMTNHPFLKRNGDIINIGTVGGQTKSSTGYTFQFIQKDTDIIVQQLLRHNNKLLLPMEPKRYHFYDSVFLNVLATGKIPGKEIFTHLFRNNSPMCILQFLDNQSSLLQDIKLISTLPTLPFLKAGLQQLL